MQWSCAGATGQHVAFGLIPLESEGCCRLVAVFYAITMIKYFFLKKKKGKLFFLLKKKGEKRSEKLFLNVLLKCAIGITLQLQFIVTLGK